MAEQTRRLTREQWSVWRDNFYKSNFRDCSMLRSFVTDFPHFSHGFDLLNQQRTEAETEQLIRELYVC